MRNKKAVRLTESQLHNIIAESVDKILTEAGMTNAEYAKLEDNFNKEWANPLEQLQFALRLLRGKYNDSTACAINITGALMRNLDEETLSQMGRILSRKYPFENKKRVFPIS